MPGQVPYKKVNRYPWLSDSMNPDAESNLSYPVDTSTVSRNQIPDTASINMNGRVPSVSINNVGTRKGPDWKTISGKAISTAQSLAPFASNIVNAFRKPPMPAVPKMNSYTNLTKINLDDERSRISRGVSNADVSADRNLPSNTAAAIKAVNLGTKISAMSSIAEKEANANAQISNQQAQMDMQTQFLNNRNTDQYNDALVERNVAQQREQSQNIANAADKYVAIQNEKNKEQVDLQKTQMLSHIFDNSQVLSRVRAKAKAAGEPDPLGRNYEDLAGTNTGKPIFKMGGRIPMKRIY